MSFALQRYIAESEMIALNASRAMIVKIVFTTTNKFISKLIRMTQKHGASHVCIEYFTIEPCVLEATWPVIIERPRSNREDKVVKEYIFSMGIDDIIRVRRHIGRYYDSANLLLLGVTYALSWLGVKWKSWKSNPHQFICTDMVVDLLNLEGFEKTTLDDLIDIIDEKIAKKDLTVYS